MLSWYNKTKTTGPIFTKFSQTDAQYSRVYSTKIWRWFEKMRRYENFLLPEIVNKRRGDWFWSTIKQKLPERFTRNFRRQTHNILKFIAPKYSFTRTKMWLWHIFISPCIVSIILSNLRCVKHSPEWYNFAYLNIFIKVFQNSCWLITKQPLNANIK